jgi:transcriptional regulator with XRE-family HTH domain
VALSPSAARRRFGNELRTWREHAGLTQMQFSSAVPISQSQVSAIERGAKGTTEAQVRRFDDVLNTQGALLRRWHDSRKNEQGYASWFVGVAEIEQQASEIREYCPLLISGLLQSKSYAHAVLRTGRPTDTDEEITELVTRRIQRQELLNAPRPPVLWVIIEEHVLRRPIGGPQILSDQLTTLLDISEHPKVTVSVVPADTEVHPGQDGPFLIFTVPGKGDVCYSETRVSGTPSDDPEVIRSYRGVFAEIAGVALPPKASRQLISRVKKELTQ